MSPDWIRRTARGVAVALALLGVARLSAQVEHEVPTTAGSDIAIRVSTPLRFAPHFGFFPLRVAIDNGSGQAGTWSIRLTSGDAAAFPGLAESAFTLEVPAGATSEQWYFAPLASPGVVATPDYDPDATPSLNSVLPARDPNTPAEIPPAATRATETAASAVLEPTGLLDTPWGVTETITTKDGVVTFAQTGSPGALIKPPAGTLPAGVLVNLHPSLVAGQVVRTITYVDPADLAALQEAPTSRVDAYRKAVNRNLLSLWRYGYLRENGAVEITLPNNFGDRDGVVTSTVTETGPASLLTMPEPEALPPDTLVTVTAAAVPPGGVVRKFTVTTLVPAMADDPLSAEPFSAVLGAAEPGQIAVEISGPGLARPIRTDLSSSLDGEIQPMPPVAVQPALEGVLRERLALGNLRSAPTVTAADPNDLPADWRVWSSMHGVFLNSRDYAQLDAERREALRRWVAMGGRLVISTNTDDGGPAQQRIGAGSISYLRGALAYVPTREVSRQLQLSSPALGLPARNELSRDITTVSTLEGEENTGTRWLIFVLIGFGVVAGPVNLLWLAPQGRRHRVFFTMPAIAVLGAVVMGAGIVVRVGLGGEGERTTLVALLPDAGGAAVFQDQVTRTGMLTSRRFSLPDDAVLAAVPLDAGEAMGSNTRLVRTGTEASGDWYHSRDFQAFHLRRFVETDAQVTLVGRSAEGAPIVSSTLSTPLTDFAWIDADDRIWTAARINPGEETTLGEAPAAEWPILRPGASRTLDSVFATVAARTPGRWLARSGESDLVPIPTLASISWNTSEVLVTGLTPTDSL